MTELPEGASPVDTITAGTRLREWEVVRLRGRGSYGVVFEARRSSWLDEPARALKVFDPIVSSSARHALLAELSVLTETRHPHLLAGIDAFDLETPPFAGCVVFVLELATEDLATRVARLGPLPVAEAAALGADVASGLAALHELGRVHGDVKPENILQVDGRWVLGDFGVTGVLEGSYADVPGATIDYRPPEAAGAEPGTGLHRSTDIWALGVSLHVAATGRHPYPGADPLLRYSAVVRGDRRPAPDLDPRLAQLLDSSCLAPEPQHRDSADAAQRRLRQLADGDDPAPGPAPGPGPGTDPDPGPGPSATLSPRQAGLILAVTAAITTAVACQAVALAAGALPAPLPVRRGAYLLVSAVTGAAAANRVRWAWPRRPRPLPWPPARAAMAGAAAATWVVATAVLFGLVGW